MAQIGMSVKAIITINVREITNFVSKYRIAEDVATTKEILIKR